MDGGMKLLRSVPAQTFRRLPDYYNFLKQLQKQGAETVAAPAIAKNLGLNEVQVRKDLAAVSECGGKPRTGFKISELLLSIGRYLGYHNMNEAILVGAGQLGRALLSYDGFGEYGLKILAAFDNNPDVAGQVIAGKQVFAANKIADLCKRMNVRIGILTVPVAYAQEVSDMLVEGGILAIWNFAPTHLLVPKGILVQNVNMAASLAMLSQHLQESIETQ